MSDLSEFDAWGQRQRPTLGDPLEGPSVRYVYTTALKEMFAARTALSRLSLLQGTLAADGAACPLDLEDPLLLEVAALQVALSSADLTPLLPGGGKAPSSASSPWSAPLPPTESLVHPVPLFVYAPLTPEGGPSREVAFGTIDPFVPGPLDLPEVLRMAREKATRGLALAVLVRRLLARARGPSPYRSTGVDVPVPYISLRVGDEGRSERVVLTSRFSGLPDCWKLYGLRLVWAQRNDAVPVRLLGEMHVGGSISLLPEDEQLLDPWMEGHWKEPPSLRDLVTSVSPNEVRLSVQALGAPGSRARFYVWAKLEANPPRSPLMGAL